MSKKKKLWKPCQILEPEVPIDWEKERREAEKYMFKLPKEQMEICLATVFGTEEYKRHLGIIK